MEKFQLQDYQDEIRAISENNGCTLTAAVDRMIVNLNTFRGYHRGTGTINYHQLGQFWCNLSSAEKVAQKEETKKLIMQTTARANRRGYRG